MAFLRSQTETDEKEAPAYTLPTFSSQEYAKLNQLVGAALIDPSIGSRLLVMRDTCLQEEFGLAESTWTRIMDLQAFSLEELCRKILRLQNGGAPQ